MFKLVFTILLLYYLQSLKLFSHFCPFQMCPNACVQYWTVNGGWKKELHVENCVSVGVLEHFAFKVVINLLYCYKVIIFLSLSFIFIKAVLPRKFIDIYDIQVNHYLINCKKNLTHLEINKILYIKNNFV